MESREKLNGSAFSNYISQTSWAINIWTINEENNSSNLHNTVKLNAILGGKLTNRLQKDNQNQYIYIVKTKFSL